MKALQGEGPGRERVFHGGRVLRASPQTPFDQPRLSPKCQEPTGQSPGDAGLAGENRLHRRNGTQETSFTPARPDLTGELQPAPRGRKWPPRFGGPIY